MSKSKKYQIGKATLQMVDEKTGKTVTESGLPDKTGIYMIDTTFTDNASASEPQKIDYSALKAYINELTKIARFITLQEVKVSKKEEDGTETINRKNTLGEPLNFIEIPFEKFVELNKLFNMDVEYSKIAVLDSEDIK